MRNKILIDKDAFIAEMINFGLSPVESIRTFNSKKEFRFALRDICEKERREALSDVRVLLKKHMKLAHKYKQDSVISTITALSSEIRVLEE